MTSLARFAISENCSTRKFAPSTPLLSFSLGTTILKQQRKCPSRSLRSLHLWRMLEMVAPGALVFRPLVKGHEDSVNEIEAEHKSSRRSPAAEIESSGQCSGLVQHQKSAINGLPVKSGKSDWLRIRNEYSAYAQKIGSGQSSRSLLQARRIVVSGDENDDMHSQPQTLRFLDRARRLWGTRADKHPGETLRKRSQNLAIQALCDLLVSQFGRRFFLLF